MQPEVRLWLLKIPNALNSLEFLDSPTQYRRHVHARAIDRFSACMPQPGRSDGDQAGRHGVAITLAERFVERVIGSIRRECLDNIRDLYSEPRCEIVSFVRARHRGIAL